MQKKRCWTEISLGTLREKYSIYKSYLPLEQKIMAVVKADAYGHGDQVVAKYLSDVEYESEVVLLGKSGDEVITADDLANLIGTIGYEIICEISKRVEKVYID